MESQNTENMTEIETTRATAYSRGKGHIQA
jgi:hypothetical protein